MSKSVNNALKDFPHVSLESLPEFDCVRLACREFIWSFNREDTGTRWANPGGERLYGEYSKMAAVLCGLVADSLPVKTVSEALS